MELRTAKIFHVDRGNFLKEDMALSLGPNGLSPFGNTYHHRFGTPLEQLNDAEKREILAEDVRRTFYPNLPSRFTCMFGALTLEEAIKFGKDIDPRPESFRIYEVYSPQFYIRDTNLIDAIPPTIQERAAYMQAYWEERIYQGALFANPPRPPKLEVVIPLGLHPLKVGTLVAEIKD
ncbi:DUF2441 domain-containing protein [Enterobacter mori]|uniref:DUF2441 domain-containing protein n=1 Tax=Enterobacter mori TaxID=539813 RepID=UPI0025C8DC2C|nr:DUF2441 domain-containing protein [Enterobacter mori]EME8859690.1 DUF2441 domain-containing protein [Enterobacter mori]